MDDMSDAGFAQIIAEAMDRLPKEYIDRLDNVAITYDDAPSQEQRRQLHLRGDQTLYGLYEGVPLTRRGNGYSGLLPDKITLFKLPLLDGCSDVAMFRARVLHTLWHEIAHYFGLDHDRIHQIEARWRA